VVFFLVSKSLKIGNDGEELYLYVGCNIILFQYSVFMAAYLQNQTSYRQVVMNRRSMSADLRCCRIILKETAPEFTKW
jgi:hypothetical protein